MPSPTTRTVYSTSQVTIGNVDTSWRDPKQLLGRNPNRRRALIQNAGPWGIWLQDPSTSTGDEKGRIGYYVAPGAQVELWGDGEIYVTGERGASVGQPVRIMVLTEEERPA